VLGSATGARRVCGEGAGQGEAKRGSPRQRRGGEVEEGLQGGGVLLQGGAPVVGGARRGACNMRRTRGVRRGS
jgi:hypothetical protein